MKDPNLRMVMGWGFAAESLLNLSRPVRISLTHPFARLLEPRYRLYLATFLVAAVLYAVASRIVLKKRPSARIWGIIASLTYLLVLIRPYAFSMRRSWFEFTLAIFLGTAGLLIFALPEKYSIPDQSDVDSAAEI
jgi:hypothetical protein